MTPVYVVTGFLGSGKTRFLSKMLRIQEQERVLVLQFEEGESQLDTQFLKDHASKLISYTKNDLEAGYDRVLSEITEELKVHEYQEIWVEWNGMEVFSKLERMILQFSLRMRIHMEKVFYIAQATQTEMLLGQTGDGPISQVAASDMALLLGCKRKERPSKISTLMTERGTLETKNLKQMLRAISPSIEISLLTKSLFKKKTLKEKRLQNVGFAAVILLMGILLWAMPYLRHVGLPLNTVFTIFMGAFLQGVPFLIMGVLLSSAIRVFLPKGWLEKIFPSNPILGMAVGVVAGFFLPVCDCAAIPIFKSLLKKGVPLSAAVSFMAAAPVVNPVVLMSTYYAFNMDIRAVLYRTGLGILCASVIGLTFFVRRPKDFLRDSSMESFANCTCGCYEEADGRMGKAELFLHHAQMEFYSVGKYLVIGIFISALFQVSNLQGIKALGSAGLPLAVLAMMTLAFLLSLCSTSDAVVARSLSGTFPFTAMLGFLVFGPMMDIKNVLMLHGYFKGGFVWRLCITAFLVCLTVVLLFGFITGGVTV